MPEYWFKYGVTEIFMEISEEIAQRKIRPDIIGPPMDIEGRVADFLDELSADRGLNSIQVLYDHCGETSLKLLKALVERFLRLKPDGGIILMASSWRLDPEAGRKHLSDCLRRLELNLTPKAFLKKGDSPRIEELVDESIPLIVATSAEPHGVFGEFCLREATALSNLKIGDRGRLSEIVDEVWGDLLTKYDVYGLCVVGDEVLGGSAAEVDLKARSLIEEKFGVEADDADMIIAGAGGYPRDSTLESSIHLLDLLADFVVDGGLVGLVAECRGGLGSKEFVEALVGGSGSGYEGELVERVKEVLENRRVALTSTLPRAILENLLGVRGFDTPQDLLTYGLRIYSRGAKILIAEDGLVKRVKMGASGRS
ncbi:MAG: hypothetical protein B6U65_00985 [Candidatus Wolframiiraptor sp. EX4484-121]|nr:MAG: hypothetical protein B6U65_00985 [Candidatus Wolframiiraptor sp. EX4484-121]